MIDLGLIYPAILTGVCRYLYLLLLCGYTEEDGMGSACGLNPVQTVTAQEQCLSAKEHLINPSETENTTLFGLNHQACYFHPCYFEAVMNDIQNSCISAWI